jgi:hypothetical protein
MRRGRCSEESSAEQVGLLEKVCIHEQNESNHVGGEFTLPTMNIRPSDRVLEIGSGHNPNPRADVASGIPRLNPTDA